MSEIVLRAYEPDLESVWNEFVLQARSVTFLLDRSFMDYHADRFVDASLLFFQGEHVIAALPAEVDEAAGLVRSHGGLTYGGLIVGNSITTLETIEVFKMIRTYYREKWGCKRLLYKPIPYIYSNYPAQEDLYALFTLGAKLESRAVSSVVMPNDAIPFRTLRMRGVHKAQHAGLRVETCEGDSQAVREFWEILNGVLTMHHHTQPVHTVDEMLLLMDRFPSDIVLHAVYTPDNVMVAGTWVFITEKVIHAQYIAASERGRELGALDLLFHELINDVYCDETYFDFGISTEQGGRVLNEGLIFQKEGFGARAVCYDSYTWDLTEG